MKQGRFAFGLVGLGQIASLHAKAIEMVPGAFLASVFSKTPGKAEAFCEGRPQVRQYACLEEFLSDPELDVVSIATPSGAHLGPAMAAMEAGKAVIIEKPMETTPQRIDALIRCSKKNNVVLAGTFQSRFHEVSRLVKTALDEGRFGRPTILSASVKWHRDQEYYSASPWHGTLSLDGGGALMNQSIHAIDLLQWFGGPVAEVMGLTGLLGHRGIEAEDTGVAALRFESGALGVVEGSTAAYPGFLKRLEICGTKGSAVIEEESLKFWRFDEERPEDAEARRRFSGPNATGGGASDPMAIGAVGHARCFANLIDALKTKTQPEITGEEARKAVEIITAIYQSARTGAKVVL